MSPPLLSPVTAQVQQRWWLHPVILLVHQQIIFGATALMTGLPQRAAAAPRKLIRKFTAFNSNSYHLKCLVDVFILRIHPR